MRNSHPVEISGLTKSYGDVNAVDDLSLVVKTGEVHGLLGPNGAGKTTVLKCLFGHHVSVIGQCPDLRLQSAQSA